LGARQRSSNGKTETGAASAVHAHEAVEDAINDILRNP
jgi:hypothetical protein